MSVILLAEDDSAISEPLTRAFAREGYEVLVADNGNDALAKADGADLIVLDLGLPDMDGLDVARGVREKEILIPIIILTARAEELDMVVGLDAGADDYVTKPFRLAELLARVRALLRRSRMADSGAGDVQVQDVQMDFINRKAYRAGQEVHLTTREFEILKILMVNAGQVISRESLLEQVWGNELPQNSKTMDMHISWLRRKLGEDDGAKYISTVRGTGFRFETGE